MPSIDAVVFGASSCSTSSGGISFALGGSAALLIAAKVRRARAQHPAMPVIGYLSMRSAKSDLPMLAAFRQGLNETGFVEGKNVIIEYRWGDGQYDRLAALAENLVGQRVAVIVTSGGGPSALAAKTATTEIPVVFNVGEDPVQAGLIASINRPGGNLTGVTSLLESLGAKQLGLLRESVPRTITIAMLVNPNDTWSETQSTHTQAAARELGQDLIVLNASAENEIDAALCYDEHLPSGCSTRRVASALFVTRADHLVGLSARHALPAIYFRRELADAGGLMSYGSSTTELYGQMGIYTGKILNGAKPADLPVMQPTKFELVINLKTAKALGLKIPDKLLALADEVIE
jgi:putative ABC transport system substrate-binding protein